jgi:microcystin-dependent protein
MKNLIFAIALIFAGTQGYSALQKVPGRMITMPGVVVAYGGSTAPDFCVFPYGQVLVRATYPTLFAIYGTTYNTGGEAGTDFRMPDLRGRTVFGDDNMGGSTASRITNAGSGVVGTTLGAVGGNELLASHAHASGSHVHAMTNHVHTQAHTHTGTTDASAYYLNWINEGEDAPDVYQSVGPANSFEGADAHTHSFTTGQPSSANTGNPTTLPDTGAGSGNTDTAGTGSSANLPPAIIMNWCILI